MDVENLIKKKNIKLTTARIALLKIFSQATKPLSYEEIKNDISMDKATFYRNISKFEDENLLNSFESNDKKRYFEIVQKPHAHFICTICNKIECVKDDDININLNGHTINNVILQGSCKDCS
jgi:Fur family ferric uptake transcriptional regulator